MEFEVGDKVRTITGLYMDGWRKAGLKGKVVRSPDEYGTVSVQFKGIDGERRILSSYLELRKKAEKAVEVPEVERPFKVGDSVVFTTDVFTGMSMEVAEGIRAEVVENIPNSNLVAVDFGDDSDPLTVAEEVLQTEGEEEDPADPDEAEIQDSLALILERIEEIKTLLTAKPQHEVYITVGNAFSVAPEAEEEPVPEPVFKKAKEVKAGDMLYTEAGAYDKVDRVETKDSGYTSLYGTYGNRIVQVPSGRMVQVLEPVA